MRYIGMFWIEIENTANQSVTFNPKSTAMMLSKKKRIQFINRSEYVTYVNQESDEDVQTWSNSNVATKESEIEKINRERNDWLNLSDQIIQTSTIDPQESLKGCLAYVSKTYDLDVVYLKKGERLKVTIHLDTENHEFDFSYN